MTTKTLKTVLFASLIAAMILPFSMMDIAEAQDDKKQKKINKLEKKLQKIEDSLTKAQNKKTELEEKLANAKNNKSEQHIKKLEEKINKKEKRLQNLEDKKLKFEAIIAFKKGDTTTYDQLSLLIDNEIAKFVKKTEKFSDDSQKLEKLNKSFAKKMTELQEKFEPQLDIELQKMLGANYIISSEFDRSKVIEYYISEKFKLPMQKKFESDMLANEEGISILGFEIIPSAYAACSIQPIVSQFKQVNVDIVNGVTGDNPLQTVSKEILSSCLTKYTLTFKDQDHPYFDVAYDVAHYIQWQRVTDIEVFYVNNDDIWFLDSGSKSQTFNKVAPIHYQEIDNFSNTVYVSNTWNHLMDTSNTNPSYSMKTWYK